MMDALTREKLLAIENSGEYPLCKLTAFGSRVMRGCENFEMEWQTPPAEKPAGTRTTRTASAFAGISVPRDPGVLTREEEDFMEQIHAPHPKKKKSASSAKRKLPPWLAKKIFAGKKAKR